MRASQRMFKALKSLYQPVRRVTKPIALKMPWLNRCLVRVKAGIERQLEPAAAPVPASDPVPESEPELEPEPVQPSAPQTVAEPSVSAAPESVVEPEQQVPPNDGLPDWLLKEWRAMHEIEPQLFPDAARLPSIPRYEIPTSRIAVPYLELCSLVGDSPGYVFPVPWIKKGGADLETLNYLDVLADWGVAEQVVVITTENRSSEWQARVPEGMKFVELGRLYPDLNHQEQEALLTRVLLQLAPPVVHNMNSELAYRVFIKNGRALSQVSSLYTSLFCGDLTPDGRNVGYSFTHLNHCYEHFTAVMCDNQAHLEVLAQTYAFDRSKMHVHYQPAPSAEPVWQPNPQRPGAERPLRVLWAGRLDTQKRPDLLIEIAGRCLGLPIQFDVYGGHLLGEDLYTGPLQELDNVRSHGSFDGMSSLPVKDFDIYLYTSQWDGLPNVLLEAMSLGLPVISASVGGIHELITPRDNAFLVDPFDDVDQYVACLQEAIERFEDLEAMAQRAREVLADRHSWSHFAGCIKAVPGYAADLSST